MAVVRLEEGRRDWLEALAVSDACFTERFGLPVATEWMAEFNGIVRYCLEQLDAGADPAWGIHLFFDDAVDGALVGNGGWKGAPVEGIAELGYAVAPDRRGRGIATDVVRQLLAQAAARGLRMVIAHTLPEESPSTSVLRRCGFAHVGDELEDDVPVWRWERR